MSIIPPRVGAINAPGQDDVGTPPQYDAAVFAKTMPEIGETLRVVNVDVRTIRLAWNSRQYVIQPGMSDFMPFDGVKVYVGDPRATNVVRTNRDTIGIVSFLPDRATEVRRLRLLYAAPFGEYMRGDTAGGIFVNSPDDAPGYGAAWEGVHIPLLQIFNIRGERIITVLDDPEGTQNIPIQVTRAMVADDPRVEQLMNVVHQRDALIDAMAAKLGIDPNSSALDNAPDVTGELPPDDAPDDVERHDDGTPVMVMDQRSDEVKVKRRVKEDVPTTLDDLREDRI